MRLAIRQRKDLRDPLAGQGFGCMIDFRGYGEGDSSLPKVREINLHDLRPCVDECPFHDLLNVSLPEILFGRIILFGRPGDNATEI